ncbi:tetraacyldisaccharide 4'-kinase [uncultured Draconibacterium sp.]|uniref:tetraacyldisaccharide 4'-kinase n=1 Tax=uncultured Draconibacterium sp. TaxID=1573823 RepID=UPI002AA6EBDB|nr:tetraacyldisaccharide 4'-kinase [uncultured Draconibacterium sp.]
MVKILLYPLSWLYGTIIFLRNRAYDLKLLKSREFDVPVISIGNITVGGTGKTPHVEYLVELLKEKYGVATLSRGYKRKTKGFRLVEVGSSAQDVGDEPLQIKNKFPEATVSVCENRVSGVEKLLEPANEKTPDVVLLDDAFQHRRISPGINILLIDYNRQLKNDALLPVGRLREGMYQMRRANIIIFTKCPEEVTPIMRRILGNDVNLLPYQSLYFTRLVYGTLQPVFNAPEIDEASYKNVACHMLVVTGIASPKQMHSFIRKMGTNMETLSFPDHHAYSMNDVREIEKKFKEIKSEKKLIVTTEKDAMRFKDIGEMSDELKNAMYYLPVKIDFLEEEKKSFNKKILNYVGENKSNRELHKRKNSGKS